MSVSSKRAVPSPHLIVSPKTLEQALSHVATSESITWAGGGTQCSDWLAGCCVSPQWSIGEVRGRVHPHRANWVLPKKDGLVTRGKGQSLGRQNDQRAISLRINSPMEGESCSRGG